MINTTKNSIDLQKNNLLSPLFTASCKKNCYKYLEWDKNNVIAGWHDHRASALPRHLGDVLVPFVTS